MKYINVVIDNNSRHTDTYYTYGTSLDVKKGDIVKVPFNRGNKLKSAYVFQDDVVPECDPAIIKEIESLDGNISLTSEIMDTCIWMKRRYGIKYLDAVKCFAPNGKPAKEGKEKEPYKDVAGNHRL